MENKLVDCFAVVPDDSAVENPFPYLVVHIIGPNIDKLARFRSSGQASSYKNWAEKGYPMSFPSSPTV